MKDQKTVHKNIELLRGGFESEQKCLYAKLQSSKRISHSGDQGEVNEQFFIDFLRSYLPNRYTVEKAIVVDHFGAVSDSIDIVVFDRQYTPTLWDNDKHRYVPAEAIYAVFECKPTINKKNLEYTGDKISSVRNLKRTTARIPHANGEYQPKPLHDIFGGILAINVEWSDNLGKSFKANLANLTGDSSVDCGFAASGAYFDLFEDPEKPRIINGESALAFFAFRLLWKLQSLGTVPAVDWMKYANQFNNGL